MLPRYTAVAQRPRSIIPRHHPNITWQTDVCLTSTVRSAASWFIKQSATILIDPYHFDSVHIVHTYQAITHTKSLYIRRYYPYQTIIHNKSLSMPDHYPYQLIIIPGHYPYQTIIHTNSLCIPTHYPYQVIIHTKSFSIPGHYAYQAIMHTISLSPVRLQNTCISNKREAHGIVRNACFEVEGVN